MNIDKATGEILPVFWKTPHNHDTNAESDRTALACKDPTLTQQHAKDETDINTIVDKFLKTGEIPPVRVPPTYQEFHEIFDFQTAMNALKAATDSFMALPARVRNTFQNDPAKFVAYVDHCTDTGDLEPLREMGLAVPRATEAPKDPPKAAEGPTPPKTPPEAPKGPST